MKVGIIGYVGVAIILLIAINVPYTTSETYNVSFAD